jgi:hypothetical protein
MYKSSNNENKDKIQKSVESLDTLDSCSYTIRSRCNSNTSVSSIDFSRSSSIDLESDKKTYNNFINIDNKEAIEVPESFNKFHKKRTRDENLEPLSKSPSIKSILEKIPSLKLNEILTNSYKDISSNVLEIK